jgi:hypothetical protein
VRGIKRGHQFDKVEMYMFEKPETANAALEKLVRDAEECAASWAALPHQAALHRRHRLRLEQDLRHRGLGRRPARVAGGQLVLEL